MDAEVQQVLTALKTLYTSLDKQARDQADNWLKEFQRRDNAWAVSQSLLHYPEPLPEGKLFAAQTFRVKIVSSLSQVSETDRVGLRESLFSALRDFAGGQHVVLRHLCLALADLALQMGPTTWPDPAGSMITQLGGDAAMASTLLEFLRVLAEEEAENYKLNVISDFGSSSNAGPELLTLLDKYVNPEANAGADIINSCYACLNAWVKGGHVEIAAVVASRVFQLALVAIDQPEFTDHATDLIVNTIHETQENANHMPEIAQIATALSQDLAPRLTGVLASGNEDLTRQYCRIFVEAGECYTGLILRHPESFVPIVEAIALCAGADDLEIIDITVNFWYVLRLTIVNAPVDPRPNPLFSPVLAVLSRLIETIVRLLRYPADGVELRGEERDKFRSFRHKIGNTLKDICAILGSDYCLGRALERLQELRAAGGPWQELEASLFSMRTMGAEIDPYNDGIVPQVLEAILALPPHPKLQYAAILVVGRYSLWLNHHPAYIPMLMPLISSGFDNVEGDGSVTSSGNVGGSGGSAAPYSNEVSAATAQTLRYICEDCGEHLVPLLGQLYTYMSTRINVLSPMDLEELAASIAYIIVKMPGPDAPTALYRFCELEFSILARFLETNTPETLSRSAAENATEAVKRLIAYTEIVQQFEFDLPDSCAGTVTRMYDILERILVGYTLALPQLGEEICLLIKRGQRFFGIHPQQQFLTAVNKELFDLSTSRLLPRLGGMFAETSMSIFVWMASLTVENIAPFLERHFGVAEVPAAFTRALSAFITQGAALVADVVRSVSPSHVPDTLEEFTHLVDVTLERVPAALFEGPSATFQGSTEIALLTLQLPSEMAFGVSVNVLRVLAAHAGLRCDGQSVCVGMIDTGAGVANGAVSDVHTGATAMSPDKRENALVAGRAIRSAFRAAPTMPALIQRIQMFQAPVTSIAGLIFVEFVECLIGNYSDWSDSILTTLHMLSAEFGPEIVQAIPIALAQVSEATVTEEARATAVAKLNEAVANKNPRGVKDAFEALHMASLRSRRG